MSTLDHTARQDFFFCHEFFFSAETIPKPKDEAVIVATGGRPYTGSGANGSDSSDVIHREKIFFLEFY